MPRRVAVTALLVCAGCSSSSSAPVPADRTSEVAARTAEVAGAWMDSIHSGNLDARLPLASPTMVAFANSGHAYPKARGRQAAAASVAKEKSATCDTQLSAVGARRALYIDICTIPDTPSVAGIKAFWWHELEFDFWGRVSRAHAWRDFLTLTHQRGVSHVPGLPDAETPRGQPIHVVASGSGTERRNAAAAAAFVRALADREVDAVGDLVASGYRQRDVTEKEARVFDTPKQYATWVSGWLTLRDPLVVRLQYLFAAGDYVVVRFTTSFTLTAPLPEAPNSAGKSAYVYNLWVLRFDGGKIAESWQMRDRGEELRQLGLLPFTWFGQALQKIRASVAEKEAEAKAKEKAEAAEAEKAAREARRRDRRKRRRRKR